MPFIFDTEGDAGMFNFFKKDKIFKIIAPITGKVLDISQTPDPVFSEKMVGDGVAIEPIEGLVLAPIDGEVVQLFPTKHAIGLKAANGVEVLIHIGIDTVKMQGQGFSSFVNPGDKVKIGDRLLAFDLSLVEERAKSVITPIVITNLPPLEILKKYGGNVIAGSNLILEVKVE